MPLVYRGMKPAVGVAGPLVADNNANALGVRTNPPSNAADVVTYLQNEVPWVAPMAANPDPPPDQVPQGISVASGSGCNLPPHRRPKGAPWNGTGAAGLQMWQLDTATLVPQQLAARAAPLPGQPQHAVISPGQDMALATYRGYIAATAANWALAPNPDDPCPTTTATAGAEPMEPNLPQLADSVGAGAPAADLVTALLEANARGVTATALVAGLEAAVQRADEAGNEEGAESLRNILDRITGYCAPPDRITLR
ncbi:MAG: hypothetical protein L0H79_19410 [Intrasporangium sp.]|uniref:hypothetical protein n=1 Tax=Intrasporangium sp. TaxID=1925024 RepID=UPI002648513A|nr:hypothetical protein [Intrasporangium sp.]MDN5797894.1 hypothetical protein [Intrasporangium sp.]